VGCQGAYEVVVGLLLESMGVFLFLVDELLKALRVGAKGFGVFANDHSVVGHEHELLVEGAKLISLRPGCEHEEGFGRLSVLLAILCIFA
jgi:hypothetical protein